MTTTVQKRLTPPAHGLRYHRPGWLFLLLLGGLALAVLVGLSTAIFAYTV